MSSPAYLLTGERFLAEEVLDRVRKEEGTDPLSETHVEAATADVHQLIGALDTPSLIGGKRLVVVNDAEGLRKDALEALDRYLASPAESSVLVVIANGRSKLQPAVEKVGTVVSLELPKGKRLIGWIRSRANELSIRLDDRGAWAMVDSVGTELRDLEAALQQLSTAYGGGARLGAADVRRVFSRLADERIFALTDGLGERRLPVAMKALRRLLDQGDEPLVVLGSLVAHIRRLLRARAAAERGPGAVADTLGLPRWRAERIAKQALAYREEELAQALELLAATDVEMKGGDLPPDAALERVVVQVITGAVPAKMF